MRKKDEHDWFAHPFDVNYSKISHTQDQEQIL